jgi:hypothetical protein
MSRICKELHRLFNRQQVFRFPFADSCVPGNEVYAVFEDGETAHQGRRIVRIGTHRGDDRLACRLREHYVNENKDRSIFRRNVGCALLTKDRDPFISQWELDLTSRAARAIHLRLVDLEKQKSVEKAVSEHLRKHVSFAVCEVPMRTDRVDWEALLIGTLNSCAECKPSQGWLGSFSPKAKIRESGLWQEQGLRHAPLSAEQLIEFTLLFNRSSD